MSKNILNFLKQVQTTQNYLNHICFLKLFFRVISRQVSVITFYHKITGYEKLAYKKVEPRRTHAVLYR